MTLAAIIKKVRSNFCTASYTLPLPKCNGRVLGHMAHTWLTATTRPVEADQGNRTSGNAGSDSCIFYKYSYVSWKLPVFKLHWFQFLPELLLIKWRMFLRPLSHHIAPQCKLKYCNRQYDEKINWTARSHHVKQLCNIWKMPNKTISVEMLEVNIYLFCFIFFVRYLFGKKNSPKSFGRLKILPPIAKRLQKCVTVPKMWEIWRNISSKSYCLWSELQFLFLSFLQLINAL